MVLFDQCHVEIVPSSLCIGPVERQAAARQRSHAPRGQRLRRLAYLLRHLSSPAGGRQPPPKNDAPGLPRFPGGTTIPTASAAEREQCRGQPAAKEQRGIGADGLDRFGCPRQHHAVVSNAR